MEKVRAGAWEIFAAFFRNLGGKISSLIVTLLSFEN